MKTNSSEPLLTKPEAARDLRICVRSLDNLISKRAISVIRLGKSVRIEPTELQRLKENFTIEAVS